MAGLRPRALSRVRQPARRSLSRRQAPQDYDPLVHRSHDVDRFSRWARTYDRHWMQRAFLEPVQRTVLELAEREVTQPEAILDVGCGTGRLLRSAELRFPAARLVGVDPAIGMLEQAVASLPDGSAIRFQQATAEELPFANAEFDLVFSTVSFHHWRDQGKGIAEVGRVLAPDGRWLLADFIASGVTRYARRLFGLKRFPERTALHAMLSAAGLEEVAQRKVPRLGGQLTVIAIAAGA
jgi:SAM-dependent methyltransferase